jgi:flavin-dependent dehydrogenase
VIDRVDVAVIGAGPAGAAAATALARRGTRVLLVDDAPIRRRWRVGETLAGHAIGPLEALGADSWLEQAQIASTAIASAWGSDDVVVTNAITNPYGGGWHIDRAAFDRMLVDGAEAAGARVWRRTRATALVRDDSGFDLKGDGRGPRRRARAPFIVDATGPARWAARRLGGAVAQNTRRQVGIAAHLVPSAKAEPWSPALLLEACADGWWYSVPVPGGRAVAVFVTDADLLPRGLDVKRAWRRALAAVENTRERLARYRARSFQVHPCGTSRVSAVAGPGWAAIGDAAMVFDPLSSRGIPKALESGLEVASALSASRIAPDLLLQEYAGRCEPQFADYYRTLCRYFTRETRWPDSPFWQRRHEWAAALPSPRRAAPPEEQHAYR